MYYLVSPNSKKKKKEKEKFTPELLLKRSG